MILSIRNDTYGLYAAVPPWNLIENKVIKMSVLILYFKVIDTSKFCNKRFQFEICTREKKMIKNFFRFSKSLQECAKLQITS